MACRRLSVNDVITFSIAFDYDHFNNCFFFFFSKGLQDVTAALQRVQQQLKKNGHAGQGVEADLAAVQSLLLSPAFRSALTIHSKVQEVWCCGQPTLSSHQNVQQLVTEVC